MELAKAFSKKSLWRASLNLLIHLESLRLQALQDSFASIQYYNSAVSSCTRAGEWQSAWQVLRHVQDRKLRTSVVTDGAAVAASERGSQWQTALQLLKANIVIYTSALSACRLHWPVAMWLLSQLSTSRLESDIIISSAAISSLEKAAKWRQAVHLLSEMHHSTMQVDVIVYNSAISACEKSGEWQWAFWLFSELQSQKLQADVVSYSTTISACEKVGLWQYALHLFTLLSWGRVQGNVITYSALASAYENAGLWELALSTLHDLTQSAVQPDVMIYSACLSACEQASRWSKAIALFQELHCLKMELTVVSYSAALKASVAVEHWRCALALFSDLLCWTPGNLITSELAVTACEQGRQCSTILEFLADVPERGLDILQGLGHSKKNLVLFGWMAATYCVDSIGHSTHVVNLRRVAARCSGAPLKHLLHGGFLNADSAPPQPFVLNQAILTEERCKAELPFAQ